MGIYYYAVDENEKKQIWPPEKFANKSPGVFHPTNPFPGMIVMMNVQGYHYEIVDDFNSFHDDDEYEDITVKVYEEYKSIFKKKMTSEVDKIIEERGLVCEYGCTEQVRFAEAVEITEDDVYLMTAGKYIPSEESLDMNLGWERKYITREEAEKFWPNKKINHHCEKDDEGKSVIR